MKKKNSANAGMTLVELMFATGISAVAMSMIFGGLMSITVVGRMNQHRLEAANTLASIIEEINSMPHEDLLAYSPPELYGPGVAQSVLVECLLPKGEESEFREEDWGTETQVMPGESKTLLLPLSEELEVELPNPLEIRVTLTWQEENGQALQAISSTMKGR